MFNIGLNSGFINSFFNYGVIEMIFGGYWVFWDLSKKRDPGHSGEKQTKVVAAKEDSIEA
jgi:hypothetical protein